MYLRNGSIVQGENTYRILHAKGPKFSPWVSSEKPLKQQVMKLTFSGDPGGFLSIIVGPIMRLC